MATYYNVSRCVSLTALLVCMVGVNMVARASDTQAQEDTLPRSQMGDLLLFPDITATRLNVPVSGLRQNELMPELDLFYSIDRERLSFLAEFLLNRDENEMERLQLGWLVQPASTVWIGRFHNPIGFWNTEYHHGGYMQTTVSRPAIMAFEDEGGVIPTHLVGLLAEGTLDRGRGSINYAFGLGKGPRLNSTLEPMDILRFRHVGDLAASARLGYRSSDDNNADEFGGFAGYTRIPMDNSLIFDEVYQTVAGVFYTLRTEKLRLIGELFYMDNHLKGPAVSTGHADFGAGYLQVEYQAFGKWTLFGRLEGSHGAKNDAFLNLIPEFLTSRIVAGSRVEVAKNQALKLELSRNERQDDARFNQASLQWSMVFP